MLLLHHTPCRYPPRERKRPPWLAPGSTAASAAKAVLADAAQQRFEMHLLTRLSSSCPDGDTTCGARSPAGAGSPRSARPVGGSPPSSHSPTARWGARPASCPTSLGGHSRGPVSPSRGCISRGRGRLTLWDFAQPSVLIKAHPVL